MVLQYRLISKPAYICPRISIFSVYQRLDPSIQDSLNTILTPLIRSLGPNHAKLLGILRHFPPGAEKLALRIMQILTPEGNTSPGLVATVKGLLSERQLDPRFMIPIAGEMDKVSCVFRAKAQGTHLLSDRRSSIDTCLGWYRFFAVKRRNAI